MVVELDVFHKILNKYNISVDRPQLINDCNQIFTRDLAFVIEDKLIVSNILPHRDKELSAIEYLLKSIPKEQVVHLPEDCHMEGGDVILWKDFIFIGTYSKPDYPDYITARTNKKAVNFIEKLFPHREVIAFDLIKSNEDARNNCLHLDCCFQPIGQDRAIVYKEGFINHSDYLMIEKLFSKDNLFLVTQQEMYDMSCNVLSISNQIIVSEKSFVRLNKWMQENGFLVEPIPFKEISKQEGLLRCATLPIWRS
ncbi:N-Dimethylarginine dimethylaminohydrolase [Elysia marginata]|uniref:N-Dimethylarginine dimethylaminohydrolase n=1 Tax=Elysia marginata TaxID=1093978 RepID=A0AAV4GXF2_9GAST|nr:N-Dimethylarginine dimethylaminohydrolase [Elysia marginata]